MLQNKVRTPEQLEVADNVLFAVFEGLINSIFPTEEGITLSLDIIDDPDMMYAQDLMTRIVVSHDGNSVGFTKFYRRKILHFAAYFMYGVMHTAAVNAGALSEEEADPDIPPVPEDMVQAIHEWMGFWATIATIGVPGATGIDQYRFAGVGELYPVLMLDRFMVLMSDPFNGGEYNVTED